MILHLSCFCHDRNKSTRRDWKNWHVKECMTIPQTYLLIWMFSWHVHTYGMLLGMDSLVNKVLSISQVAHYYAIKAGGPANVAQSGGWSNVVDRGCYRSCDKEAVHRGNEYISAVPLEMNHPSGLLSIIMEEIQLQQSNPLAIPKSPNKKTYDTWAGIILSRGDCSIRSAELKAKGRKKPFLNLRNNVAFAAVMSCLFTHRNVHPELLLSTDDVSILIHPSMSDMKPVVQ